MGFKDAVRRLIRGNTGSVVLSLPASNVTVCNMDTAELYASQPNLRAVVDFLATNVAQLPLKCYSMEDDGGRRRLRNSTAAQLFARPNAYSTRYEMMHGLVSDLKLYDACVWMVLEDADSPSGWEMHRVPQDWVVSYVGTNAFYPEAVVICSGRSGNRVEVPASSLLVFKGYNPSDPWEGCSPVESLKQSISEQVSANKFRSSAWKNGGQFGRYITRPADVEPWTDDQAARFKTEFRAAWTGGGENAGGIPVLEDGMSIHSSEFSAKEAEWAESVKFTREDVAGVYHVNPALIWPGSGQTYASAKENSRALYNDTLGPLLVQLQERFNAFLLPMIGSEPGEYVEFDLSAKLAGSFEEQAAQLSSACGAPYLTRNEVRARLNHPAIDGGDELIVPLNVLEGGLASPRDTDPTKAAKTSQKAAEQRTERKARGDIDDADRAKMEEVFSKFFARQAKSVLPKIGAGGEWWDEERWQRELADDLDPVAVELSAAKAARTMQAIGADPDGYSVERTRAYIRKMCESIATAANSATKRKLDAALEADDDPDVAESTPAGVFEVARESRATRHGGSFATAVAGWSVMEAVRQSGETGALKTWVVTSGNPRPEHAAMDGETVPFGEKFSNGADWPGDSSALDAADVANCQCQVEITIP